MKDETNEVAMAGSPAVLSHPGHLAHPNGHSKYESSVSLDAGVLTLSLRYVERRWLPLSMFGRLALTKMVRVSGDDIDEAELLNDAQGLACSMQTANGPLVSRLLGVEWPSNLREEVREKVDTAMHARRRGIAFEMNGAGTIAIVCLFLYLVIAAISGSGTDAARQTSVQPAVASMPAAVATVEPIKLTPTEADGMSSAAAAQEAANRLTQPIPMKEALSKASFITLRAPGAGAKTLIVWSDPLCPHCRDFDQKVLPKLPTTVGVMVIPVSFKHGSRPLVAAVACGTSPADRAERWKGLMLPTPTVDLTARCETGAAVADVNSVLFAQAGLKASPSLMTTDGTLFDGDLESVDAVAKWIAK